MRSAMSDSCPSKSNGCCISCTQKKRAVKKENFLKKKKTPNFLHSFLAVTVKVLCRWGPVLQVDQDACNYLHIKKVVAWPSLAESDERRGRHRGSSNTYSWSTKHSIMNCAAGGQKKKEKASAADSFRLFLTATGSHHGCSLWKSHPEPAQQGVSMTANCKLASVSRHLFKPLETCIIDGALESLSH